MQDPEKKLTHKQYIFALEYVKDYNGKQAYIRAGYSENGAEVGASNLLSSIKVQEAIAKIEEDRMVAIRLTAENILRDIVDLRKSAVEAKQLGVAARCDEMLARILLNANSKGLRAITSNPDGTVKIIFDEE